MEPFLLFGIPMHSAWSFRTPMILLLLVLYNETCTRPSNTKKPLDSAAFLLFTFNQRYYAAVLTLKSGFTAVSFLIR